MTLRNLSFVASVMLGIGLAAPVSHSLAAAPKSLTTLTVVDSRNKVVGQATALLNARDPLLVFRGQDVVFSLYARPSGLTGTQGVLYFTSEDCTGTPYPFLEPVKAPWSSDDHLQWQGLHGGPECRRGPSGRGLPVLEGQRM